MIKTNELRIGNIVQDHEGNLIVVFSIHEAIVNESWSGPAAGGQYKLNPGLSEADIYPIPLTPEWLGRCGFADNLPWEKGDLRIDSENRAIIVDSTGYGVIIARQICYLHQLQNLYYDMKGEVLEIKENV